MLKSKYFWIAMVILVPFAIVWIMAGFGWAIATLVIMVLLFLFIFSGAGTSRKKRRDYYYEDDDEEIIDRRPRRKNVGSTSSDTHVYLHQKRRCPACNGTGSRPEYFITRCPKCGGKGWIWD